MTYIDNPIHLQDGTANPNWLSPSVTLMAGDLIGLSMWVECNFCGDLWDVVGVDNAADADAALAEEGWHIRDGRHYCSEDERAESV